MRSKSHGPGHRQGEGAAGNEYQEVRIFGTISEVAYFSVLLSRPTARRGSAGVAPCVVAATPVHRVVCACVHLLWGLLTAAAVPLPFKHL